MDRRMTPWFRSWSWSSGPLRHGALQARSALRHSARRSAANSAPSIAAFDTSRNEKALHSGDAIAEKYRCLNQETASAVRRGPYHFAFHCGEALSPQRSAIAQMRAAVAQARNGERHGSQDRPKELASSPDVVRVACVRDLACGRRAGDASQCARRDAANRGAAAAEQGTAGAGCCADCALSRRSAVASTHGVDLPARGGAGCALGSTESKSDRQGARRRDGEANLGPERQRLGGGAADLADDERQARLDPAAGRRLPRRS